MHKNLIVFAGLAGAALFSNTALAENAPGITDSEIKIGQTMPFSGPLSAYSAIGKTEAAYFQMINEQGGVNGRKINLISLDDSYSPPKIVEQTRKLVEEYRVAFIFGSLGTPTNTAIQKYLNSAKIPQLFIGTGADKWGDYQHFPWTMAFNPSYRSEAQIYAKFLLKEKPDAKIGVIYQNDDFGKDYVLGLKDVFGDRYAKMVVKEVTYEVSDPTVDSQIVTLHASGADVLITVATAKAAAQAIRKVADLGWKPLHILTNVSASIGAVFQPAGMEKSVGIITAGPYKDQTDPALRDDAGLAPWRAFMAKYMPSANVDDAYYPYGYSVAQTMVQVLKQCGNDLSRNNIMKQAANLHHFELGFLLPGITLDTSPTKYHPITQMQLYRFDGRHLKAFGGVISGS
jgi:branched-chain amino acid transport system substrate-binding protein